MLKLQRLSLQPILQPIAAHSWERSAVFNAAAVSHAGKIHLFYRATDLPCHERYGRYISRLGHAVSADGMRFEREAEPAFSGCGGQEERGVEDPRITYLEGKFYMTYTGFGGRFDGDYRICMASSTDLINWTRHGVVLDEPNKDAALFPERIGGRYVLLHRRYPDIWLCYSQDLRIWTDHKIIMRTRPDTWEAGRIGAAGPPIKTPQGWLLIYHAADTDNVYRLGAALLDLNDPSTVIHRQERPILEPELAWERDGWVPNVVFSNGHVIRGDRLLVYYGGADTCLGVAQMPWPPREQDFS
ncbi:MAG: glycosidase [Bacteroidota bacterium]